MKLQGKHLSFSYRFMLEKLEAIKVPKVVQVIDALPRTFNGKVIKRMLKEM